MPFQCAIGLWFFATLGRHPEDLSSFSVLIRGATIYDIPFIMRLERACVTAAHWSEEQYREAIEGHGGLVERAVLVADAADSGQQGSVKEPALSFPAEERQGSGGLAGFLVALRVSEEWELENIVVDPQLRGKGLGFQLLRTCMERVRAARGRAIYLEVRESNTVARKLYEKAGFREIGRRKLYYSEPAENAVRYSFRF